MHISWLGTTALKLQTKPFAEDVIILIDPYKAATGTAPRSLTSQLALFTRGLDNAITLSGDPFVLATPGECDVKGVLVTAVEGHTPGHTMLRIDAEQMSIGHIGLTKTPLSERQEEVLSGVDILCLPVGHPESYDSEQAMKIVNDLEPRVVIPIAFYSDNDPTAKPIDSFMKEMGGNGSAPEKKIILKKKDLPQEETTVVVLAKE